jgi:hypothetical protein
MLTGKYRDSIVLLCALCVLAVACTPTGLSTQDSDPAGNSHTRTSPWVEPFPAPSISANDKPATTLEPSQLLILHTNDNWGETEPCG